MFNVLLVEDLEEGQLMVKRALANSGINLLIASTVTEAIRIITSSVVTEFHLFILDLNLPDGEGLSLLEKVRSTFGDLVPVFLLTSDTQLDSKVLAFNLGADDYLTKPISAIELKARIEMRLKKNLGRDKKSGELIKGNIAIDPLLMRATLQNGDEIIQLPLTAKEFKILAVLLQSEGRVFSRQDLVSNVWGKAVNVLERTVDSHIFGLRKKLGAYAHCVECIPNVGYRFISPTVSKNVS